MSFYNQSIREVEEDLNTHVSVGLDENEVLRRRNIYGLNELKEGKKINPLVIFLKQFHSFIIYILLFAVILSLLTKEYFDSGAILTILIFNAFFGFLQEYRAERAIESLKKLSSLKARVIRNGKERVVDSRELVPGDIVIIEEGDKIPADARVIESVSLNSLESSLTGESNAVSKIADVLSGELSIGDRKNMLFSGTVITRGRGKAIVVSTGMKTEIGKIANLITGVKKELTPLQKKLDKFGKFIGFVVLSISAIIFLIGIGKEGDFSLLFSGQYLEFILHSKTWLLNAVALAVAAVPEGLPAIVTISLAIGVRKMLKKNALIRRLPSVETLGVVNVICSDKTGTLTKNEMTVVRAFTSRDIEITGRGYELNGQLLTKGKLTEGDLFLFKIGALCNNSSLDLNSESKIMGDPTEAALLISAEKAGIKHLALRTEWKREDEDPFDSVRKMMSTLNRDPRGKLFVFTKGAPERVIEKSSKILVNGRVRIFDKKLKAELLAKNDSLSKTALRVLGFAYKEYRKGEKFEENLVFVGLQGMIDPPRDEVKGSVEKCKLAGIRVIMVTGDNRLTAEAIANQIGINGGSMNGLDFAKLSELEQKQAIENIAVFSRVEPEHKMRIVQLLQGRGYIVAMTGDGVNDAPALKKADIGIAMGIKGTDVAKESSDMILQDDNFVSIVNSVEEGRGIYENIKKFINYLLSSNLAEVLIIFVAILIGLPLPLTAIMLLWINLITDGLPALALSADPYRKDLMSMPPKKSSDRIMNKTMVFNVTYTASLITIAVLGLFYWAMINYSGLAEIAYMEKIQTIAFTALIFMEFARLQAIRSESKVGIFSNKYLIFAIVASVALQLLVIYSPIGVFFGTTALSVLDWSVILGASAVVLILNIVGIKIRDKIAFFRN